MLKTLEEPPEHIKFILATTDPQKIPVTVLSRCLQFNLKQMPPAQIITHLTNILTAEKITTEAGALRMIAKAASGSMRDALSLLDQAIAHGAGALTDQNVQDMLGTVGEDHLHTLLDALAKNDLPAMLTVAQAMDARALSFDSALQALATLLHRVALVQLAPEAVQDEVERAQLLAHAAAFEPEYIQLAYSIVIHGREELSLAPDEYAGFTMTLMRLAAFSPHNPPRIDARAPDTGPATPALATGRLSTQSAPEKHASTAPAEPPAAASKSADLPKASVTSAEPTRPPAATQTTTTQVPKALATDWPATLEQLRLGGMVRELAHHCELIEQDDSQIKLRLNPVHKSLLINKSAQDKLQAALTEHLGQAIRLTVEIGALSGTTPAEQAKSAKTERHNQAVASLEEDSFVREAIEAFDATLSEKSIKPL